MGAAGKALGATFAEPRSSCVGRAEPHPLCRAAETLSRLICSSLCAASL